MFEPASFDCHGLATRLMSVAVMFVCVCLYVHPSAVSSGRAERTAQPSQLKVTHEDRQSDDSTVEQWLAQQAYWKW